MATIYFNPITVPYVPIVDAPMKVLHGVSRAKLVDETDEEKISRLEKNIEHLQKQLRDVELENRDLKTQIRPLKLQIKHFEDNGYKLDKMLELYKLQEILVEYGVSYDIENKTLTWSM